MKKEVVVMEARHLVASINAMCTGQRKEMVLAVEQELKNLKFGEDIVDGLVFKTKDLTQFKDVTGNRIVNENSVYIRELANSISRIGNIAPIIINEDWAVIDGQRRLKSVRKHGLSESVKYIREEGTDIETIGEINKLQVKWNYKDWLNKYASMENPSYIRYQQQAEKYEPLMRSRSLRGLLMNFRVDPLPTDVWESGRFEIDEDHFNDIVRYLELLKKVCVIGDKDNIFAKDRSFQKALFEIYKRTKKLDEERLLYKIRYGFGRLNVKTDFKTYKKILGELYNSRLSSDKNHIVTQEAELSPVA